MNFEGKVAVITGSSAGIGAEAAKKISALGGKVTINYSKSKEAAEEVAHECSHLGGSPLIIKSDIATDEGCKHLIDSAFSELGAINILINNAGVAHVGNIEACSEEDLDRLYEINIKGVYNCSKACISLMKDSGGGVILNLASIASSVGISDRFAYSMTKGAVLTMTYSIAKDYINHNIRCNCVSPARVHTPFVDGFIKKN